MTPISDWLAQAYSYEHGLSDVVGDPAPGLAGAGYDAEYLASVRNELAAVEQRCHVSAVHRKFLDRVLEIMNK